MDITRLLDNYKSIYYHGFFWIFVEVIKVLKFPAFWGNDISLNVV